MARTTPSILTTRILLRYVLALLCLAATTANAQGVGTTSCSVGLDFDCAVIEGRGPNEDRWLRAVIIWKSGPWEETRIRDSADAQARLRRLQGLQRAAEDSGRLLVGVDATAQHAPVTMTSGFPRRASDSVFVLGQAFALPSRDSALVLLIDTRRDRAMRAPSLVATAWISSRLAPGFWLSRSPAGDTTAAAGAPLRERILQDTLARAPAVRAFLRDP